MAAKEKDIEITVELDEDDIPETITWKATDLSGQQEAHCRAMLLAMWDHEKSDTMRLDLWTKQMNIDDMKIFFHQTLVTLADTFENATEENKMADDMRDFTAYFADKMGIKE